MAKRPRLSFLPVRCNHKLRRDSCFHKVNGYHAICPPANLPRLEGGTISLALLYGKRPLQYTTCGNVLLR
jgi:hypothetical protein